MKFKGKLLIGMIIIILLFSTVGGIIIFKASLGNGENIRQEGTLRDSWNRTFGGSLDDFANRVTYSSDGYIYITGMTNVSGDKMDIFITKYDTSGNQIWFKTYGTTGMDTGNGITLDSNNNVYVVGTVNFGSAENADIVVLKYDSNGNLLWNRYYNGGANDRGMSIVYNSVDNSIYVTGISRDTTLVGGHGLEVITIKYDTSGNLIWAQTYDYTSKSRPDGGFDIAVDGDGYIYVTGTSYTNATHLQDLLLLKYDTNGNLIWARVWGSSENDLGWRLTIRNIPFLGWRIFIVGFSFSASANEYMLDVVCYDTNGNYRWSVSFDNNGDIHFDMNTEIFINAGINADSNYIYVVGESKNRGTTGNDTFLLKYDANGTKMYEKYWNHKGRDFGRDIVIDPSGWAYIVGGTQTGKYFDAYVMQINTSGEIPEFSGIYVFIPILAVALIYLIHRKKLGI